MDKFFCVNLMLMIVVGNKNDCLRIVYPLIFRLLRIVFGKHVFSAWKDMLSELERRAFRAEKAYSPNWLVMKFNE